MQHQFVESENVLKLAGGITFDLDAVGTDIYYYLMKGKTTRDIVLSAHDSIVFARELLTYLNVSGPYRESGKEPLVTGVDEYVLRLKSATGNSTVGMQYGEGAIVLKIDQENGQEMAVNLDADACILLVAAIMRALHS